MVETETIIQMISTLGFPIVMVCFFAWYTVNRDKDHKEEIGKLSDALNNNTLVMTKLLEKLESEDK